MNRIRFSSTRTRTAEAPTVEKRRLSVCCDFALRYARALGGRLLTAVWVLLMPNLIGCSRGPVVSVTNRSSVAISNAVISGPRFTNTLGTLGPGEERRVVVHPRGESHVRLHFEAASQTHESSHLGYFEDSAMYRVSLTVTTNLQVEFSSDLKGY